YTAQVPLGLGASIPFSAAVRGNLESSLTLLPNQAGSNGPGVLWASASYRASPMSTAILGAGLTKNSGDGSAGLAFSLSYKVIREAPKQKLIEITNIVSRQECSIQEFTKQFTGRALAPAELEQKKLLLPYFSTEAHKYQVLSPGDRT